MIKYSVMDHHCFWQREKTKGYCSNWQDADVVFVWTDLLFEDLIEDMRKMGKKVIVFEHGFGALYDYEINHREPIASGYLALGVKSKESLVRAGVDENKILVTGNPLYDDIHIVPKRKIKKNALFVALHWTRPVSEYNSAIFSKLIEAYPQFKWSVKLTEKTGDIDVPGAVKKIFTQTDGRNSFRKIKELLNDIDVVFSPTFSTFESIATLMGIPVYVVDKDRSFRNRFDPDSVRLNCTYIDIGQKLPRMEVLNLNEYIRIPSMDFNLILDWCDKL